MPTIFLTDLPYNVTPSSAQCFAWERFDPTGRNCSVTQDMITFLNLTHSFNDYFGAYCLNPPASDGCPYGYCPNSDIAAVLVFYHPNELQSSFWAQILNIYALLLACGFTTVRHHITRIHAILTVATAGSPLSIYIFIYAIRSLFREKHRMSATVGKGHRMARYIVLLAMAIWVGLLIYVILPASISVFDQEECETGNYVVENFFFLPILIFKDQHRWAQVLMGLPVILTTIVWMIALVLRRDEIWQGGESKWKPHPKRAWRTIRDSYPFVQFWTVVLLPTAYWVATIELGVHFGAANDTIIQASFGQGSSNDQFNLPDVLKLLAIFVAIPPVFSVLQMYPRFHNWFLCLTWVRFCRRQMGDRTVESLPISGSFVSLSSTLDDENMDEKPLFSAGNR
ncbi:hypothetical protein M422DRAFT_56880 [Sphaerobolus stellatus SS14]|uniref:Uncharacterized protein n=1 Tax=Sphaerobolus stellatus (strain SS14) TaxID=990650 RepID=A0A0C9UDT8_SPHS4|nr:hypothetical protein M422DRAFT_56880 [Sphaerobolus stellatus SS14]